MMDKELIRRNFSIHAKDYDMHCSVQNLCALKLISRIEAGHFSKILDIGCGTGNYTKLLREKFPSAEITAMDISRDMIEITRKKLPGHLMEAMVADAETENLKERFDFITSNSSFQWFENLEKTLIKYRALLSKNGLLLFSTFGPLTFKELKDCLRESYEEDMEISSSHFIDKKEIEEILEKIHFRKKRIEEEIITEHYPSLLDLLSSIKYTGTRGVGINARGIWTPAIIDRLERIYRKKFKSIRATYQVFFCQLED